jgi:hypothetical protein
MQKRPESKTIAGLFKSPQTILLAGGLRAHIHATGELHD